MSTLTTSDETLDDIMLAMDVVDTLRHEHIMVEKDLALEDRRENLIARLHDIYKAQGIDVPDAVLMDGVMALEEHRFSYTPPKSGVSTKLARLYIRRKVWLPLIYTFAFIIGSAWVVNFVGFVQPAQKEAARVEQLLTATLPEKLSTARNRALAIAATDPLKSRAEAIYRKGQSALNSKDADAANLAALELTSFATELEKDYTVRIVSRPNQYSGVFRVNDDAGAEGVRNYYLIIEAIDPTGKNIQVVITSEEDRKTREVSYWGVRVTEEVFNAVAADKQDDRIIQNDEIGQKTAGYLHPVFTVETAGGYILDW